MAKRNWFENIENEGHNVNGKKAPARDENSLMPFNNLMRSLFGEHPFEIENVNVRVPGTFDDFVKSFNDLGFKDKGDSYELVTNLGGQKTDDGAPEDSVKVEFNGDDSRMITVNYSHSTSDDDNSFYSHTQSTSATLPDDADEDTITAHFDEDNNVVVTVKKKTPKNDAGENVRSIPVSRR